MNKYNLNFTEDGVKYLEVYNRIKELIENGQIVDGEKLPTIRGLACYLKVNKITIINAYRKLTQEDYIYQCQGSGTYAKRRELSRNFKKDYNEVFKKVISGELKEWIDFTGETTSANFFKVERLKNVLNNVLTRDGVKALIYNDYLGYKDLRKTINNNFWDGKIDIDNMIIISGAQQGIDIIAKSLINSNDNVVVEKPTYGGALTVFKWRKANILEVPIDSDGICVDYLEKLLKKYKIQCLYTMSYFQNPTGVSCSLERKKKIIELAHKYDFYIIEDDYLSELRYDESIEYSPYRSLDSTRVIYIKSFSKIFLPGIRIGYLIAPPNFNEAFQTCKINTDIATSSLMQRALEEYIKDGYWLEHIKCLNNEYSKRYKYVIDLIKEKLGNKVVFNEPNGGLNLFLKIKDEVDITSKELFYELKEKNTIITPGAMFYKNSRDGDKTFRIGFSQIDYKSIEQGVDNIYEVLKGR